MPPTPFASEPPTLCIRRAETSEQVREFLSEGRGACRIFSDGVPSGQPGLNSPRQRIAIPRLSQRDRCRRRNRGNVPELTRCTGLFGQPNSDFLRVARLERKTGGQRLAHPEDGIHCPRWCDLLDRQVRPLRKLVRDQGPNQLGIDVEFALVHLHARIMPAAMRPVIPADPRTIGTYRADTSWQVADARAPQWRDDPGVLRGSAINDDGSVFTRELDHVLLRHDAAARDSTRAPWLARVVVLVDRGPGYVPLSGGASVADVSRVAS